MTNVPEELNSLYYSILIYLNNLKIEAVRYIFLFNITLLFGEDCFTSAIALNKILLLNPGVYLYFLFLNCGYQKILN